MEPVDAREDLDALDEWDAIEDLQDRLEELEKKHQQLKQTLHWSLGGVIAFFIIFNGAF